MHKYIHHPNEKVLSSNELSKKLYSQLDEFSAITKPEDYEIKLQEIYQLLETIDGEPDPSLNVMVGGYVKEFVTTFLVLFYGTKDIQVSLEAHSLIKSLTKYIVLLDKHYDEKNYEYKARADIIFKKVMSSVDGYLKHAIIHGMSTLWATATYEINLRGRMLHGEIFNKKEIRNHIFLKSSDTELYGIILDNAINSFNPNILQLIHYNQAILDIQDDLTDIDEDILRHDLNVFVMSAASEVSLDDMYRNTASSTDVVRIASSQVLGIIDDFEACTVGIHVPTEYYFLKKFSSNYIKTLRKSIKNYQ